MIKEFEQKYLDKYYTQQKQQWENYNDNNKKKHDLNKIDESIYHLVNFYKDKITGENRKDEIAMLIINRALVDKATSVSTLRNRIDNLENYKKDHDKALNMDRYNYRVVLAQRMRDDVLELMNNRNELAKNMGFSSYPDLVFATEEINKEELLRSLNRFLDRNLDKTRDLIRKYNMNWKNWFNDLNQINVRTSYDAMALIKQLFNCLGYKNLDNKIKIKISEEGIPGMASSLTQKDIRINVRPTRCLDDLRTLFHEIGHVLTDLLNDEEGLFRMKTSSYDEAMAVIMEYIASDILLDNRELEKVHELMTLEYTRCAISALYELELWDNPIKAEELYIKYYSKLGLELGDPSIWAYDTFRSIDPVYIHNYVTGAWLGEKLIKYLKSNYGDTYNKWGEWLYKNVYCDGRKRSLTEKINFINQ